MNNQKQESKIESDGSILEVHSIFKTIQGEGPFAGTPAIFIRLAGCNLQCPGCDTDYTSSRRCTDLQTIVQKCIDEAEDIIKLVVITGGEPFRQNIEPLIKLLTFDFYIQIETNGTIEPPISFLYSLNTSERIGVYVVCSPKTLKIHKYYHKISCAFKYVLNHNHIADDGLPTSVLGLKGLMVARSDKNFKGQIYLTPEDTRVNKDPLNKGMFEYYSNELACVNSCLMHGYIFNIQLHKLLGLQ